MSHDQIWIACIVVTFFAAASLLAQEVSVDDVIAGVAVNEQRLHNIRADSITLAEQWDAESEEWRPFGETQLTAWYAGSPGSKSKIKFHRRMLPQVEGGVVTGFSNSTGTFAFNGHAGQTLREASNNTLLLRGEIDSARPGTIASERALTGWGLSVFGVLDKQGLHLSESLSSQKDNLVAQQAIFNGERRTAVMPASGDRQQIWYFDPARSYALVGYEKKLNGIVIERLTVHSFIEPTGGIYYPENALIEYKQKPGGQPGQDWRRTRINITAAKINDPEWNDAVFDIAWPSGTVIRDKIVGVVMKAGAPAADLNAVFDEQIIASQQATHEAEIHQNRTPQINPRGIESQGRPRGIDDYPPGNGSRIHWLWVGAIATVCIAALLIVIQVVRRRYSNISTNVILLVCFALLAGGTANFAQSTPPPDLDEVIDAMRDSSGRLHNVKVEFELKKQEQEPGGGWESTDVGRSGVAWLNGLPQSKVRINYNKKVTAWTNGESEYLEQAFDVAYDGREGRRAVRRTGPMDKTGRVGHGAIYPERPRELAGFITDSATGALFSTPLHNVWDGESLHEHLAGIRQKQADAPIRVENDVIDGVPAFKITLGTDDSLTWSYWVDPNRGYALLRHDKAIKGKIQETIRITDLAEAAPGVWYPTGAYYERDAVHGKAPFRYQFKASSVVVNDPDFDESIFTIQFPSRYIIQDQVRNIRYETAPTPEY